MGMREILASIDQEISQLQHVRALLTGESVFSSKKTTTAVPVKKAPKKKRNLSPEGRKRIAEAVRRRWASQKKAAEKKKIQE